MGPRLLCVLILSSVLVGVQQISPSTGTGTTILGVWSDDYTTRWIIDETIVPGPSTVIPVDVNVTNIPKFIGNEATSFNGLDISVEYDPSIVRISSSSRFVFDANKEDTIVSVTPAREPTLAERNKALTDFDPTGTCLPPCPFPVVKFIDLDGDVRYLIGETLLLDVNNDGLVDAGDVVVSVTPTRAPTAAEIGKALIFSSDIKFNDFDSSLTYEPGIELLALDAFPAGGDGLISKPLAIAGVPAPTCHFYEGCIFDNTKGTPLEGRNVIVVAKSCDLGCPTVTAGKARLAFVVLGPTIPIPDSGLSGTLFLLGFEVVASGATRIDITSADLTSPNTGAIPHTRLNGSFSTKNLPPNVVVTHPSVVNVNGAVQFDASASQDPDLAGGEILAWDFGDGSPTVTGPKGVADIVVHTYTSLGTFTVRLNVTDRHGGWTLKTSQITVNPATPPPPPPVVEEPPPPSAFLVYLPFIAGGGVVALLLLLFATGKLHWPFRRVRHAKWP